MAARAFPLTIPIIKSYAWVIFLRGQEKKRDSILMMGQENHSGRNFENGMTQILLFEKRIN